MSHNALPITMSAFRTNITHLPLTALRSEIVRLQNSIFYLTRSNLLLLSDGFGNSNTTTTSFNNPVNSTTTTTTTITTTTSFPHPPRDPAVGPIPPALPDPEITEVIAENDNVIKNQYDRIEAVRQEMRDRGLTSYDSHGRFMMCIYDGPPETASPVDPPPTGIHVMRRRERPPTHGRDRPPTHGSNRNGRTNGNGINGNGINGNGINGNGHHREDTEEDSEEDQVNGNGNGHQEDPEAEHVNGNGNGQGEQIEGNSTRGNGRPPSEGAPERRAVAAERRVGVTPDAGPMQAREEENNNEDPDGMEVGSEGEIKDEEAEGGEETGGEEIKNEEADGEEEAIEEEVKSEEPNGQENGSLSPAGNGSREQTVFDDQGGVYL